MATGDEFTVTLTEEEARYVHNVLAQQQRHGMDASQQTGISNEQSEFLKNLTEKFDVNA